VFIYLFAIYFLFSDAACSSNCIVSNVGMFNEHSVGEDMEGSGCGLIQGNLLPEEELRRMTLLTTSVVDIPVDIQMWHLLKYKSEILLLYMTPSL
jgi:hypothetical protein